MGIVRWLAAVCLLVGCETGPGEVTLEGAVERTGGAAFDSTKTVADYIRDAGLTANSDTDRVIITRVRMSGGENQLVRIPVSRPSTEMVEPGDIISVAARLYEMEFRSIYSVDSFSVVRDDTRYEVPKGVFAVAEVGGAAVGGVLIGEGRAYDTTSGNVKTPFHYIYIRASPQQMSNLVSSYTEARHLRREVLEDAVEIHRINYERIGFESERLVSSPVGKTLSLIPGIWLNPKSESMPGRGFRRRRFDDGRVWSTYPDGRQRWILADGTVTLVYAGGVRETRKPDGRVILDYQNGLRQVHRPDGSEETILASGSRRVVAADGTLTFYHSGGTVVSLGVDGIRRATYTDGTRRTEFTDGTVETVRPDGRIERQVAGGWTEVRMLDGTEARIDSVGRQVIEKPDGTRIYALANGVTAQHDPDGRVLVKYPDGSKQIREIDGRIVRIDPAGRIVEGPGADWDKELFSNAGWNASWMTSLEAVSYLDDETRRVVIELNKVRTEPRRYAEEVVKPFLEYYYGDLLKLPDGKTVKTKEGPGAVRELLAVLRNKDGIGPVRTAEGMCRAARDHVAEQGESGRTGHIGSDGSLPHDRIARYVITRKNSEAIAYSPSYGGQFVLQLLIDDGVLSRGHRKTMLDPDFSVVGVAVGPHKSFIRMCDIVFADNFPGE